MTTVVRPHPVLAMLLLSVLPGCLDAGSPAEPQDSAMDWAPGSGLNVSLLSVDTYAVGPQNEAYIPSTQDGILLHVEWYLPDGKPGPWPTILENSPYNGQNACQVDDAAVVIFSCNQPTLAQRYVPKGYAVVFADVRGTAESEGCMDMMGAKEQRDNYDLVEWIAAQPWSDGNVGMQGVSYVGTTPHEALIENPPHLKAVATVAGVTNQWRNVYQNGVPYSGRYYHLNYAHGVGLPPPMDVSRGPAWALNAANGLCDQEEMVEHISPGTYEKGIYDDYWAERNITARARDVVVPLLYTQGFLDRAVNPMEAIYWFNDVQGPKKAFLHQAGHQYVDRADYFDTELAWFDHYLKGIANGVERTPVVEVITNTDKIRLDDEWPPSDARHVALHLGPEGLSEAVPPAGSDTYLAPAATSALPVEWTTGTGGEFAAQAGLPVILDYLGPTLQEDLYMAGNAVMHLRASSDQPNTYFLVELADWSDGVYTFVQEGWFNAHLREGFDRSAPLAPGEAYDFVFKFEPRDYVFEAGHQIGIRIKGTDTSVRPFDTPASQNTVMYGPGGSWVDLPVLDAPVLFERTDQTGPAN